MVMVVMWIYCLLLWCWSSCGYTVYCYGAGRHVDILLWCWSSCGYAVYCYGDGRHVDILLWCWSSCGCTVYCYGAGRHVDILSTVMVLVVMVDILSTVMALVVMWIYCLLLWCWSSCEYAVQEDE